MKQIKIFGMRRTGTNYFKWLVENNTDSIVVAHGKHNAPYEKREFDGYIHMVKNPYSWISSTFSHNDYKGNSVKERAEIWNHDNWRIVNFGKCKIARYEQVILNPRSALEKLLLPFGVKFKRIFKTPCNVVNTNRMLTKKTFDRKHQTMQGYLFGFEKFVLEEITSTVDSNLMDILGYQLSWCMGDPVRVEFENIGDKGV